MAVNNWDPRITMSAEKCEELSAKSGQEKDLAKDGFVALRRDNIFAHVCLNPQAMKELFNPREKKKFDMSTIGACFMKGAIVDGREIISKESEKFGDLLSTLKNWKSRLNGEVRT
ncbi:hypothetical protein H0H93_006520 [Arthromyces matolae]|nr:hypothetical protein H0H93_006520 [Arthromyces matolae]